MKDEKKTANWCQLVRVILLCLFTLLKNWALLRHLQLAVVSWVEHVSYFATFHSYQNDLHHSLEIIEQKVLNQEEKKKGKGSSRMFSNFKDGMALKQISLVISKGVDFPLIDFFAQRIICFTRMIHIRNNLITAATFNAFAANLGLREAPVFLLL